MRGLLVVPVFFLPALVLAAVAAPAAATGGSQTFRIPFPGDAYVVALSSTCSRSSYEPPSVGPPPSVRHCWLIKDNLGYDGVTGASTLATQTHVNHAFLCAVASSAAGPLFNGKPYPVNMVGADSLMVSFDLNGDTITDVDYGGRFQNWYPFLRGLGADAQALNVVGAAQRVAGWSGPVTGPTPAVAGNVDGAQLFLFNQAGFDVTVECSF